MLWIFVDVVVGFGGDFFVFFDGGGLCGLGGFGSGFQQGQVMCVQLVGFFVGGGGGFGE